MSRRTLRDFSPFTPTVHLPGVASWLDVCIALTEGPLRPAGEGEPLTAAQAVRSDGTGASLRLVGWPEIDKAEGRWKDAEEGEAFEAAVARRMQRATSVMSGTSFLQCREAACELAGSMMWPEVWLQRGKKKGSPLKGDTEALKDAVASISERLCRYRVWILGTTPMRLKHPAAWNAFMGNALALGGAGVSGRGAMEQTAWGGGRTSRFGGVTRR